MPIFEFRCKACNYKFEELVFSSAADLSTIVCPNCGEKAAEKLMSTFCSSGSSSAGVTSSSSCGGSGFS